MADLAVSELPDVKRATPRQVRLAAIRADKTNPPRTHTEAMLRAGYSPKTARSSAKNARERKGVENATIAITETQRDRARGLAAIEAVAFENPDEIRELPTRDKYQVGLTAAKLRHDIGVEPETGSAAKFKADRSKDRRRAMHLLDVVRAALARPLDLVLSPTVDEALSEKGGAFVDPGLHNGSYQTLEGESLQADASVTPQAPFDPPATDPAQATSSAE